jgi:hypothetical protein
LFSGTLDDLTMFVAGKTVDGVDYGTFNFGTDNGYATQSIALGGLTGKAGDVNQDNALTPTDVTAFVAGWAQPPNLVNGVQVGDIDTILNGDLNFDGATNLVDSSTPACSTRRWPRRGCRRSTSARCPRRSPRAWRSRRRCWRWRPPVAAAPRNVVDQVVNTRQR